MSPLSATFAEKVLSKLDKLDRNRVERFVRGVVRERNFYGEIFEALAEGTVVMDPEGRVLMINRMARMMIGVSSQGRVLGRPLLDLVRDPDLREILLNWAGESIDQRQVLMEDPVARDLLVTLRSVRDSETGEAMARVLILADVTEHRRHEREQARSERLSSLAVLTAGVAHEIKNPLNSMRIHAQLLQQAFGGVQWSDALTEGRAKRSVEILLEETERLTRIVEQFMQAVRPVDPTLTLHSVNVILRRVLESLAPERMSPPVEVLLDLDPQLPEVWLDDQQMQQVFLNLMRNAIESLDKPTRHLTLRTRVVESAVEVTVADSGCGIAREDLERIYQPYFTTKFNGTGLGLMVVHRIVGEHGGRLLINSREGEGTEVRVLLPLAKPRPLLLTHDEDRGPSDV